MSNKFSIYKDMAMLSDIVYNLNQGKETENSYTIKQSSPANSSGFSATLYQKEDEIILALRGTETNSLEQFYYDILVSDVVELGTKSVPASQVTDMIRFIDGLKNSSDLISGNSKVTIVGHSLGGTLAQIASKMYPSLFDNCYTFNSPSGKDLNSKKVYKDTEGKYFWIGNEQVNFKHYLDDAIGQAFYNYQNSPMTTLVTDVRAKDFISPIANLYGGERFGELIKVSGETHYITPMTKILYFYDEMIKNGASEEIVTNYLSGLHKSSKAIFKGGVDDIAEQTMQKIDKIINKAINKTDIIDICQAYENGTNNINFNIQLINPDSTIPNSNSSIENLYALINLNPFIVSGVSSKAYTELEKHKDEYSDSYITNKTKMLKLALDNKEPINGIYFKDYETNTDIDTTEDFNGMYDEYHFGTNSNDTINPIGTKISLDKNYIYTLAGNDNIIAPKGDNYIEAGSGSDTIDLRNSKGNNTIYADSKNSSDGKDDGDDTIYGGEGVDTIYGGKGNDTYYVGDKDIIFDSDAKGSVIFEGVTLKGGVYDKDKGVYIDDTDNLITYRINGDDKATLIVQKEGKSLTINNYTKSSKDLGINLVSSAVSVLVSDSSAVEANQKMNFNISLDRKLEEKEYLVLRVNDKKFLFGTLPNDSNINQGSFDDDNIIEFDKAS